MTHPQTPGTGTRGGSRGALAAFVLATTTALAAGLLGAVPGTAHAAGQDTLEQGQDLVRGTEDEVLVSPNRQHLLGWKSGETGWFVAQTHDSTINLALHGLDPGAEPERLVLQDDGNLVMYARDGRPLWASGTVTQEQVRLVLQDDGNLVLYTAANRPLWASDVVPSRMLAYTSSESEVTGPTALEPGQYLLSADRRQRLVMQSDGNVVLYDGAGRPRWATGTSGGADSQLLVQTDGNVVVYDGGRPVWATGTGERVDPDDLATFTLVVQEDGNAVLRRAAIEQDRPVERPTWSSRSGR